MSEDRDATWATEADRLRDKRRCQRAEIKNSIKMWWHGVYWKALYITRLAGPYSVLLCKAGLYMKFPDGRCMYCGVNKASRE